MLNFVIGRSGTGKTTYIKNKLAQLCRNGNKKLMMLVPDQSSFETEKSFLELLGPKECRNIKVFGFSRLCDYVFAQTGNVRNTPIDEGTRKIIMSMALEATADNLELFSKQKGRMSVLELMVHSYKECLKCNITADMLYKAAENIGEETLAQKLKETSYVLNAYEAIISNTYIDPCEDLTKANEILQENSLFSDYVIAVDSFSGFTAQQYSVIECLMRESRDFYVSLTMDCDEETPGPAFRTTFETKNRIFNLAQKNGIETAPYVLMEQNHRLASFDLSFAERSIYGSKTVPYDEIPQNLSIVKCSDISEEIDFVSNNIRRLVIDENYRYKDIAVICRNSSKYASRIVSSFSKNQIPFFMDFPEDIYIKPVIRLVCSCFKCVLNNFEREDVLSVLKTELTDNSVDEISLFENYLFKWNINHSGFKQEFTLNPRGFSKNFSAEDEEQLRIAEKVRKSIALPIIAFKEKCKDSSGADISKALYELLLELNVPDKLNYLYDVLEEQGKPDLAAQQVRLWNILMETLDKMTAVLDKTKVTVKKYFELLSLQFENVQISEIPQSVDSVKFGDAQRIRLEGIKAVFIIGANEGEFPSVPKLSGVFTETERKRLALSDLPFQDSVEEISNHEKFLAYSCITAPSHKLFVLFHTTNEKSEEQKPSEFVLELLKIYPKIKLTEYSACPVTNKLWAEKPAFEYCAKVYSDGSRFSNELKNYFSKDEKYSAQLKTIAGEIENKPIKLENPQNAEKLFGSDMTLSASQIEKYSLCAFQYFCTYGLRIKERRAARIDALEFGTITHYFFEKFLSIHSKDNLSALPIDEIKSDIDKIFKAYADENLGGLEDKTQRFINLFERMKDNSLELILHMIKELSQSDFKPVDFELKIGGDIPAYTLTLPTGHKISICGSVDRVDLMEKDGKEYIRVIDYKTGGKEFMLSDVLYGLNLQMLIYLHTVQSKGKDRYGKDIVPSGILYMPAISSPSSFDVGDDKEKIDKKLESNLRMNGLILNDIKVVEGMDKSGTGRFIPVTVKSGLPSSAKSLASLEEIGHIFTKIDEIIEKMADSLYSGDVSAVPIKGKSHNGCEYCLYSSVCNYRDGQSKYNYAADFSAKNVLKMLKDEYKEAEDNAEKLDR